MYERILVGADGSDTATRAVETAARLAVAHDAGLVIAHVYSPRLTAAQQRAWHEAPEEQRWRHSSGSVAEGTLHAAVRHVTETTEGAVRVHGRCDPGRPVPVLLALVDELDPDLLVIGNRDMPGRIRARPSVSRALARRASCDVTIVDTLGRRQQRLRRTRRALAPLAT